MSCGNCTDCSNLCDVCINCDTGDYKGCDTAQTLCAGDNEPGQLASEYIQASNCPTFERDDIIIKTFPQAELNRWIVYVTDAAAYGAEADSGAWSMDSETREFVYADTILALIAGIQSIGSGADVPSGVAQEAVIYADTFTRLAEAINNLKVNSGACDSCISGCNVQCDTCNSCDSCISCNSCQSVTSYSSHYSSG